MNKRKTAWLLAIVSVLGLGFFALQFAMAVEQLHIGRILVYFTLSTACVETAFFSVRYLLRGKKS